MDVLSDVLDTVRLRGRVFGSVELAPPWGMRAASRDPRPSLAERYQDRNAYLSKVRTAALDLQRRGYLLEEDVAKIVERAGRAW